MLQLPVYSKPTHSVLLFGEASRFTIGFMHVDPLSQCCRFRIGVLPGRHANLMQVSYQLSFFFKAPFSGVPGIPRQGGGGGGKRLGRARGMCTVQRRRSIFRMGGGGAKCEKCPKVVITRRKNANCVCLVVFFYLMDL